MQCYRKGLAGLFFKQCSHECLALLCISKQKRIIPSTRLSVMWDFIFSSLTRSTILNSNHHLEVCGLIQISTPMLVFVSDQCQHGGTDTSVSVPRQRSVVANKEQPRLWKCRLARHTWLLLLLRPTALLCCRTITWLSQEQQSVRDRWHIRLMTDAVTDHGVERIQSWGYFTPVCLLHESTSTSLTSIKDYQDWY